MSRTEAADAPLPTPRPSAVTSLLADPELTVTPEKPAPPPQPLRRARKEVRFQSRAEDAEVEPARPSGGRMLEGAAATGARQPSGSASAAVAILGGVDDAAAVTSAASFSASSPSDAQTAPAASATRIGGSRSSGRRPNDARSGYSFPFTDPLDKENVVVTAAAGELAVPELNATLRVQRELEALRSRRINVDDELRQRLAGSHAMREHLKAKVYSKLNVKDPVFGDMISTDVPREQLLASVTRNLAAKAKATAKGTISCRSSCQTKRAGDSSSAQTDSQGEASRDGGYEDGNASGTVSGLHRFWSHRAVCFTGSAAPDLYQYRYGCTASSDAPLSAQTTQQQWWKQQQHLLDVYQHVRSWYL